MGEGEPEQQDNVIPMGGPPPRLIGEIIKDLQDQGVVPTEPPPTGGQAGDGEKK
jgi:hypothetical protein